MQVCISYLFIFVPVINEEYYEKDKNIDMSLGNLITLANFYNISTDYLLCRTELRKHKNQSVSDLHLNDDAVQILTDEKYNPRLLSELFTHENF